MSLVQLAGAQGLGLIPQRRLRRQFEQLAELISARLDPFLRVEMHNLLENERLAALDGVAATLEAAEITDELLLTANVSEAQIIEQMKPTIRLIEPKLALDEPGRQFYRLVLNESVAHLAEVIATLPSFQQRALKTLLSNDSEIISVLKEILERMPERRPGGATKSDQFELDYRREIARKLDQVELFGVTISGPSRRYPLNVAYIGLSVATSVRSRRISPLKKDSSAELEEFPADDVLASNQRTFIRGEAGSGKTTLLRWLALRSAQGEHGPSLLNLNKCVPFIVELRRYADKELPRPEELPSGLAWHLTGRMPAGWVHGKLESGAALILVDGVDEVPPENRVKVRDWLAHLAESYPQAKYVVTSRPAATPASWLSGQGYKHAELLPMTRAHVESFITHWHDAVGLDTTPAESTELDWYRRSLISSIDRTQALRVLSTNPLICALLCAVNKDRRGHLPQGRLDIYRTALEMLLMRRDHERGIPQAGVDLGFEDKLIVLENLAYWFTENDLVDATTERVHNRLADQIAQMPALRTSTEDVYAYLLVRSGLLREPSPGRVSFIHKTFQEYLAAKRIVNSDSLESLAKHTSRDSWREVIVIAVGHARQKEAERFIRIILRSIERPRLAKSRRVKLQFLVISCLEVTTQLDPVLHRKCLVHLKELLPPASAGQARVLAGIGEEVLPLLPTDFANLHVDEAAATVRTAALIGGETALALIREFVADNRTPVLREKVSAWSYFEPKTYARTVFPDVSASSIKLRITDSQILPGVPYASGISEVNCFLEGDIAQEKMTPVGRVKNMRSLSIINNSELVDLAFLNEHEYLEDLRIRSCPMLKRVSALMTLAQLKRLSLYGCNCVMDRDHIRELFKLEGLEIGVLDSFEAQQLCEKLIGLQRLELTAPSLESIEELGGSESLIHLGFDGCNDLRRLRGLALFSRLRTLSITDCPSMDSLAGIGDSYGLRALKIKWCEAINLDEISSLEDLETLHLEGVAVRALPALASLSKLRTLIIKDCEALTDVRSLAELTNIRNLKVSGVPTDVEDQISHNRPY
jgi:hypothetical protein